MNTGEQAKIDLLQLPVVRNSTEANPIINLPYAQVGLQVRRDLSNALGSAVSLEYNPRVKFHLGLS